jgi:hypothetical protein
MRSLHRRLSWPRLGRRQLVLSLLALLLPALSACWHTTYYASVATVVPSPQWQLRAATHGIVHVDSQVSLELSPLNSSGEEGTQFFILVFANRHPDTQVEVALDGARLVYKGTTYIGDGWKCATPIKPIAAERLARYDSKQFCAMIRFQVIPPSIEEQFSLALENVSIGGKPTNIPEVQFKKGVVNYRGW